MLTEVEQSFLSLVRMGIGHKADAVPENPDWTQIRALAMRQGLGAVVMDGTEALHGAFPATAMPAKSLLMQWANHVMQQYERRYKSYCRTLTEMAGFYRGHGIKMMVLKGYACGLNWPRPEHRPYGDIDIWQFGEQERGDELVAREKGIVVDNSHHHHSVFYWRGFMVENHYDFINVHVRKSSAQLEIVFKELGRDDSFSVELCGEKIYLPSPNLHALFLIRHMVNHFAGAAINMRHMLDWAFFVEKHIGKIDWEWLGGVLKEYHMNDFFGCINAICIEDLGFNAEAFPDTHCTAALKEKVLVDILQPEYGTPPPRKLVPKMIYRFRRWQANAWKQRLCYKESRWNGFWGGIRAMLTKPKSV